jgi:hypothetical protein
MRESPDRQILVYLLPKLCLPTNLLKSMKRPDSGRGSQECKRARRVEVGEGPAADHPPRGAGAPRSSRLSDGCDRAGLGAPIAHHQPPAASSRSSTCASTYAATSASNAAANLRRAPRDDLVQHRRRVLARRLIGHYSQHRRSFLAGAPAPAELVSVQRGRHVAPSKIADSQVQVIPYGLKKYRKSTSEP